MYRDSPYNEAKLSRYSGCWPLCAVVPMLFLCILPIQRSKVKFNAYLADTAAIGRLLRLVQPCPCCFFAYPTRCSWDLRMPGTPEFQGKHITQNRIGRIKTNITCIRLATVSRESSNSSLRSSSDLNRFVCCR